MSPFPGLRARLRGRRVYIALLVNHYRDGERLDVQSEHNQQLGDGHIEAGEIVTLDWQSPREAPHFVQHSLTLALSRDCVAILFMVREPHHEWYCLIANSGTYPFALTPRQVSGLKAVEGACPEATRRVEGFRANWDTVSPEGEGRGEGESEWRLEAESRSLLCFFADG